MKYKTKDLAEAAALLCHGHQLSDIQSQNGICWFEFEKSEECKNLSNSFFFGELLVNARKYKETMDLLKSRIFATK